jgi:hypothetical protein
MTTNLYVAGVAPSEFEPGTLLACHGEHSFVDAAIRFGQRLHMRGAAARFTWVNHVACVVNAEGGIIEMLAEGAELNNAAKYKDRDYYIIDPQLVEPSWAVKAWQELLSSKIRYGWVGIASIVLTMLTGTFFEFGRRDTIICSGAGVVGLCAGGADLPPGWRISPGFVTPAEVAQFYGAEPLG